MSRITDRYRFRSGSSDCNGQFAKSPGLVLEIRQHILRISGLQWESRSQLIPNPEDRMHCSCLWQRSDRQVRPVRELFADQLADGLSINPQLIRVHGLTLPRLPSHCPASKRAL